MGMYTRVSLKSIYEPIGVLLVCSLGRDTVQSNRPLIECIVGLPFVAALIVKPRTYGLEAHSRFFFIVSRN